MANRKELYKEWQDTLVEAGKCLSKKQFKEARDYSNKAMLILDEIRMKEEFFSSELNNFGAINHIVSEQIVSLYSQNKPFYEAWKKTIKEDKNLTTEFKFYQALSNFKKAGTAEEYVNEIMKIAQNSIDVKTLKESNAKAFALLKEYEITPVKALTMEDMEYYNACQDLLECTGDFDDVNTKLEATKTICESIEERSYVNNVVDEAHKFDEQLYMMPESTRSVVTELADSSKAEGVFNRFKNECLTLITNRINESEDADERAKFVSVKEKLESKAYSSEKVFEDVIKFIEFENEILRN